MGHRDVTMTVLSLKRGQISDELFPGGFVMIPAEAECIKLINLPLSQFVFLAPLPHVAAPVTQTATANLGAGHVAVAMNLFIRYQLRVHPIPGRDQAIDDLDSDAINQLL